jgi:hypothetical protein
MPINTPSGTIGKPPRTILTQDSRGGCPGADASGPYGSGNSLINQVVTLDTAATVWVHMRMIYNNSGRCDLDLRIDNGHKNYGLNWVGSGSTWEEEDVSWTGRLSAGTHNIELRSRNCGGRWGCGGSWGEINTMIFED